MFASVIHRIAAPAVLVWAVCALPATAAELRLDIRDGRVTLTASDVPVRQILAEWARIGETRIVNLEQVAGPPVTIELTGVPESQALDILLRSVAGYVAAPRRPGEMGPSRYAGIMILAKSAAPAPPPAGPQPPATLASRPGRAALAGPPAREPETTDSSYADDDVDTQPATNGNAETPGLVVVGSAPPRPTTTPGPSAPGTQSSVASGVTGAGLRSPMAPPPPGAAGRAPIQAQATPSTRVQPPTGVSGAPASATQVPGVIVPLEKLYPAGVPPASQQP